MTAAATKHDRPHHLLLAVGNRSRGDDAAGPLFLDRVQPILPDLSSVWHTEECYQLQPELVEEIKTTRSVWIVDATQEFSTGTELATVSPATQFEFTTHALSAASLLALYKKMYGDPAPPTRLLKIGASQFKLGAPLSAQTQRNIDLAIDTFLQTIANHSAVDTTSKPACTN